jgi:hypothetical protein
MDTGSSPTGGASFSFLETPMHRRLTVARNKLDLNDRVQVRIIRKRLKISGEQLAGLVRTAGPSIAGIRKEAMARQLSLPLNRISPVELAAAAELEPLA